MKKNSTIAAASLAAVSLFAAFSASAQATTTPTQTTLYCWKNKLYPSGSDLVCNWSDNTKDACRGGKVNNVSKDAIVAEPANVKRCDNGEWLVQVTTK